METYLRMQSTNMKVEFNLKAKMNQLRAEVEKAANLPIDITEFIQLVFFNDFNFEKYLQE